MSDEARLALERWVTQRDAEAFRTIVMRFSGLVFSTCKRVLGNAAEAEEVAQECFETLAVTSRLPRTDAVGAWLHGVATKRSLQKLRSDVRRKQRELRFAQEQPLQTEAVWDDVYRFVDEAIDALPDAIRVPLTAHFLEGQSKTAIALAMGVQVATVSYRINKGIELIRRSLRHKGIPVTGAALGVMLNLNTIEAAPAALNATLGKLALAGIGTAASSTIGWGVLVTGGTLFMMKKTIMIAGALIVILGVSYSLMNAPKNNPETDEPTIEHTAQITEPEPNTPLTDTPGHAVHPVRTAAGGKKTVDPKPAATPGIKPVTASVSGIVTDESDTPLARALVELLVSADPLGNDVRKRFKAQTDAGGRFTIQDIDAAGFASITADAKGYIPAQLRDAYIQISPELTVSTVGLPRPAKYLFSLSEGETREDIHITLKKGEFFVAGHVLSETRQPIPDASVNLVYCRADINTSMESNGGCLASVRSGDDGAFEIAVPINGACGFSVTKEGYGNAFYPSIPAGTRDATFILGGPGAISGQVNWTNGEPAADVEVGVLGQAGYDGEPGDRVMIAYRSTITGDDGRFVFTDLSDDASYTVGARTRRESAPAADITKAYADSLQAMLSQAPESESLRKGITVRAGQTTQGVHLVVQPESAITGRVTIAGSGKPAYPLMVTAEPADPDKANFEPAEANTDKDGNYRMRLTVSEPSEAVIGYMAMHFAGGDQVQEEKPRLQTVSPGKEHKLDFTIPGTVSIPVKVVDAKGAPRADAYLSIRNNTSTLRGREAVDENGCALLEGLPPNVPIQIVAWASDYEEQGLSDIIVGRAGETLPVLTLFCGALGGYEATILDPDGNPAANTHVSVCTLLHDGAVDEGPSLNTDAQGHFVVPSALAQGFYEQLDVAYQRDGQAFQASVANISIASGAISDLGILRAAPVQEEPSS